MQNLSNSQLHVFTDGASRGNPGPAAAAFVIYDQQQEVVHEESTYLDKTTNNTAEYTALIRALEWLTQHSANDILVHSDSELMVKQLNGLYKIKEPHIQQLAQNAKNLLSKVAIWKIIHIPRAQNKRADQLCNDVLDSIK